MNEADIRDLLVGQLDCLEGGLQFLEKEKYIPSDIGTRSFIDILAKDSGNNWVIIELKRSKAASRQAIHEVLKYVEAVKSHLGAREDEIRVMIVSTVWDELLVPFSSFVADTSLDLVGIHLNVSKPNAFEAAIVQPVKITGGRALSPWHELNFYIDRESLEKGISSYEKANKKKEIDDYILVILEAPEAYQERVLASTRMGLANVQREFHEQVDYEAIDATLSKMDQYDYILYFVPQLLGPEFCKHTLGRLGTDTAELEDILSDMDDEEALCTLHEHLFAASPRVFNDRFEIGYPAKFKCRLLDDEGWVIEKILRYGSLARNELLSDEAILSEIYGNTGSSGQKYYRKISSSSSAQLSSTKSEVVECLSTNAVWSANIHAHLSEIEQDAPDTEVEISIFNPATALFTLFFAVTQEQGAHYVPSYQIGLKLPDGSRRLYFGELEPSTNSKTFRDILDQYYDGDIGQFVMCSTWGYRDSRDVEILAAIGLKYRSFRCDESGGKIRFFAWKDSVWEPIGDFVPFAALSSFFEAIELFMRHLVTKVGRRINGGIVDGSSTDGPLEVQARDLGKKGTVYGATALSTECDLCECNFAEENFLVDARIPGHKGAWGYICADCVASTGAKIGWGYGQLYQRIDGGLWKLVGGENPSGTE